jgi:hypothetical protein
LSIVPNAKKASKRKPDIKNAKKSLGGAVFIALLRAFLTFV